MAKKTLKSAESVIQMVTDQIMALHQAHAVIGHYHTLAMKAASKTEQEQILANGFGIVRSMVQKAVAGATKASSIKNCGADTEKNVKDSDETKAVGKDGKPLVGIALEAHLKKCEADAKAELKASYEAKAIDKNGNPLAGAALKSFMKKCESGD